MGLALGIYAGNKAASAQRRAAGDASRQLGDAKGEAIGYLNPWSQAGGQALSPLTGLLTGTSYDYKTGEQTELDPTQRMDLFQQSPGYQFRLDEAMKAIQGSQNAKGNLLSGGAMKELTGYSQGIASDEYNNYLNQLFQLSGMGQQADMAKSNVAIGIGSQMAQAAYSGGMGNVNKYNNLSNFGYGIAGMGAQGMMGGGGSGGSGMNPATLSGGGGGMSSGGGIMAAMSSMGPMMAGSDIDLKENIVKVGTSESGIPIYHFDYKDKKYGEGRYEGVMAQDILGDYPSAVIKKDGFLNVDYSQIDVKFKEI